MVRRPSPVVRGRWTGRAKRQQFRHLHLIANNSRSVILTPGRTPNLTTRVPGTGLLRLSLDIQEVHDYPIFMAETLVDVSRFADICHRASNRRSPGLTRGLTRKPEAPARRCHHGQPKGISMSESADDTADTPDRNGIPAHRNPGIACDTPRSGDPSTFLDEVPE